jgi:hypothetical protein
MSLELIPRDGVNVCMGVAIRLPLVGYCSIELVRSKKDFLVIRALGDHEFLLNSLKPIFGFHWILGLGECGRASLQEFPKPALRWWCVISRSEREGTKPPYVCPGCLNHTYSNNMITRFHVQ